MYNDEKYLNTPFEIQNELNSFFKTKNVKTILDIGACDGLDSIKYAKFFPFSKVYSFEPLLNNFKLIECNLRKYNIVNVYPINLALSEEKGIATFYVSSGRPLEIDENIEWDFGNKSSSLLEPNKTIEVHPWLKFDEQIIVKTDTLNNKIDELKINTIDFIHMDVQGAELMVLKGSSKYISKIKMIWLEVENIELYKNQPLTVDVEFFLKSNNFVKIKDTVTNIAGDQLWVNYDYFPLKKVKRKIYKLLNFLKILK
jgi:FkbM family methyltransferase